MREYAREKRKCAWSGRCGEDHLAFGKVLGASSVAFLTNALPERDYDLYTARIDRIIGAKVSRPSTRLARAA